MYYEPPNLCAHVCGTTCMIIDMCWYVSYMCIYIQCTHVLVKSLQA